MRSLICLSALLLASCGGGPAPSSTTGGGVEAEVESAVRKHLSRRSDLDMSSMDLTIRQVEVAGDTAQATVGFEVKGKPEAAMAMQYSLAKQNGEWVVQAQPSGHGGMAPQNAPSQGLPPGHPPAGGGSQTQELPQGHPPVAQ